MGYCCLTNYRVFQKIFDQKIPRKHQSSVAPNNLNSFSVIDHNNWMSNGDNPMSNIEHEMITPNFDTDFTDNQMITSNFDTDFFDDQPKQKIKIRRKKINGENQIKKYLVRRKNTEFVDHFLTTTTTTESPSLGQLTNSKALNRTAEDSRCK